MSAPALQARLRKTTGKTDNQRLRRLQKIPAAFNSLNGVLHLEMDEEPTRHALEKLSGTHELVPLSILKADSDSEEWSGNVMLKEVQKHPYKHLLIHLDFRELNAEKPVKLRIPLNVLGEAPGVRKGGVMQLAVRDLVGGRGCVGAGPQHDPACGGIDTSGRGAVGQQGELRGRFHRGAYGPHVVQ